MEVLHSDKIKEFIDKNMTVQYCLYLSNNNLQPRFYQSEVFVYFSNLAHNKTYKRPEGMESR